ncbi:PREDICTED: decorin-like [Branchiostoma belcheri]|uniref:Decorin-like n=1 Tax=Branchiostoma belcheri TaxID=7741 RepID=A0A6P4YCP3_BRABE|nr:PREDICTED: decorin-like [Branchiostoma belcheri]
MGRKLRHLLIFLLIILKELNTPAADCSCKPRCRCSDLGLTSIPQNLPTSISFLDLKGNRITNIKMLQSGTFTNLPRLKVLTLSDNQISTIQLGTFTNLPLLQELDLSKNQITMIRPDFFENLRQLKILYLSSNQITMIQPGTFANLNQLKMIGLSVNQPSGQNKQHDNNTNFGPIIGQNKP